VKEIDVVKDQRFFDLWTDLIASKSELDLTIKEKEKFENRLADLEKEYQLGPSLEKQIQDLRTCQIKEEICRVF